MNKLTFLIIIVILSNFVAAECFLYQDSNFYCGDLSLEAAQQECIFYDDCNPLLHITPENCLENLECLSDLPTIFEMEEVEEEVPLLPQINEPLQDKENEGVPAYLWFLLSIIPISAAVYYAITRGLVKGLFLKDEKEETEQEKGIWRYLLPTNSNPKIQKNIKKLKHDHQRKNKEYQREEFLAEAGLMIGKKKDDLFSKLKNINRSYEKRKMKLAKELSKKEKLIFKNLEEVVELSEKIKQKSTFNTKKKQIRKNAQEVLEDLRKIAQKK